MEQHSRAHFLGGKFQQPGVFGANGPNHEISRKEACICKEYAVLLPRLALKQQLQVSGILVSNAAKAS